MEVVKQIIYKTYKLHTIFSISKMLCRKSHTTFYKIIIPLADHSKDTALLSSLCLDNFIFPAKFLFNHNKNKMEM